MRVLCLVDGPVIPPDRWMWNHLPEEAQQDEVDFLWASPADRFKKWGKFLSYYPQYINLGWRAWKACQKRHYDVIVAWEAKTGFPLGALRSLAGVHSPPFVIFCFSFRGIATSFPQISSWVMRGVHRITVVSPEEIEFYSRILHIPRSQITFCQMGWHDLCRNAEPLAHNNFIFAFGRSYRDYQTFLDAVDGLPIEVIVNTRRFAIRGLKVPANVRINEMMPEKEYARLLVSAKFVVIPLLDTPHAAGEASIVQTMAAGKAIVATRTHSTSYYVEDGITGILVPPKEPRAMREACLYLLSHPEECKAMGAAARRRYEEQFTSEHTARCQYAVLQKMVMMQAES